MAFKYKDSPLYYRSAREAIQLEKAGEYDHAAKVWAKANRESRNDLNQKSERTSFRLLPDAKHARTTQGGGRWPILTPRGGFFPRLQRKLIISMRAASFPFVVNGRSPGSVSMNGMNTRITALRVCAKENKAVDDELSR